MPRLWGTGMFYPFPVTLVDSLILNWKYTLKSKGRHTHPCTHIDKWKKKHSTAWFSVSRSQVSWVAFAQGVAHRGVLIVYSMRIIVTPTPLLSVHQVEHSTRCPPQEIEGELDTSPDKCSIWSSWGCVRIYWAAGTGPSLSNRSCVWFAILKES